MKYQRKARESQCMKRLALFKWSGVSEASAWSIGMNCAPKRALVSLHVAPDFSNWTVCKCSAHSYTCIYGCTVEDLTLTPCVIAPRHYRCPKTGDEFHGTCIIFKQTHKACVGLSPLKPCRLLHGYQPTLYSPRPKLSLISWCKCPFCSVGTLEHNKQLFSSPSSAS